MYDRCFRNNIDCISALRARTYSFVELIAVRVITYYIHQHVNGIVGNTWHVTPGPFPECIRMIDVQGMQRPLKARSDDIVDVFDSNRDLHKHDRIVSVEENNKARTRIRSGVTPVANCSSSDNYSCVVDAGWMITVLASSTLAGLLARRCVSSTTLLAVARSPLTPKLNTPPYAFGRSSSLARSW